MRHALAALLLTVTPVLALAQDPQSQPAGPVLTLEEAIDLALRNNPQHLRTVSQRSQRGLEVRSAYGALLPRLNSNLGFSFRAGGNEYFAGQLVGSSSDVLSSNYGLGLSVNYDLATFMRPRVANANLDAAEADVTRSAQATRSSVMDQYIAVLQAQATAALNDTLVANAQTQLELDRARQQVGAATVLAVRQSEVALAQAQVNQLRARNQVDIQQLNLFQRMGVPRPEGVRLVTQFPVSEPTLQLAELLSMARQSNPGLLAARARENAANVNVAANRGSYLPSISFSTGWSGNAVEQKDLSSRIAQMQSGAVSARRSCLTTDSLRVGAGLAPIGNCPSGVVTDEQIAALRAANDQYPFNFEKSPFGYSINLSLPIFNGFQREQQIQSAQLARNDARYTRREEELRITTDVTTAHTNLLAAYQEIRMQEQAQQAARDALELAQERYRVGAATYVELSQARTQFEQAATNLITAIYNYHRAYATLETAVGRPLR